MKFLIHNYLGQCCHSCFLADSLIENSSCNYIFCGEKNERSSRKQKSAVNVLDATSPCGFAC